MITVISTWYNEEFLAPFFMSHYSFADRILIAADTATTDRCAAVAKAASAEITPLHYPDGMDERRKVAEINRVYQTVREGYVINVDADEFVRVPPAGLEGDVIRVELNNVYRHKTDTDLDSSRAPIIGQRTHGAKAWPYRKPIIARAGLPLEWTVGNHQVRINGKKEPYLMAPGERCFQGAHWANADPCFCVERRLRSRDRQSTLNLRKGFSAHNHGITAEDILFECRQHENDGVVM